MATVVTGPHPAGGCCRPHANQEEKAGDSAMTARMTAQCLRHRIRPTLGLQSHQVVLVERDFARLKGRPEEALVPASCDGGQSQAGHDLDASLLPLVMLGLGRPAQKERHVLGHLCSHHPVVRLYSAAFMAQHDALTASVRACVCARCGKVTCDMVASVPSSYSIDPSCRHNIVSHPSTRP